MATERAFGRWTLLLVGIGSLFIGEVHGESPTTGGSVVLRLVHPERQAAEVLKLFDGARAPHPAAALAGWKRATRSPNQLGKPLEAVIAMFNPEMAREWSVMHDAELCLDLGAAVGKPDWYAVVPRDDGVLSAAITAQRVTAGAQAPPLSVKGRGFAVERLGPVGAALAIQSGDSLILGSSQAELLRGLDRLKLGAGPAALDGARSETREAEAINTAVNRLDSGLIFDVVPRRMNDGLGTIAIRRAVALLKGLGCERIIGILALEGDVLGLELTTLLDREGRSSPSPARAAVDPSWLTLVPAAGVMGLVSLALEPGAAFWDSAFALADRVDRTDPAHAGLAPIRSRLNLLAAAAGARLEVDVWPHLKGVTACVMGDPSQSGRPGGALVVLHMDGATSADRLATDIVPRLASLLTGQKRGVDQADRAGHGEIHRLGMAGGRSLLLWRRGADVVTAWGEDALNASRDAAATPERSAASVCTGWSRVGKLTPQRVGALWPARCWPFSPNVDRTGPAWLALAADPPAVWWGWTEPGKAHDSIHFSGLRPRVRHFLDQLPLDPSPLH